jgi:hypothetical protein
MSVTVSVDEIEAVLAASSDAGPRDRVLDLVERSVRSVADNEVLNRTALRHYMDTWLAVERAGQPHDQPVRSGRRRQWLAEVLDPALPDLPAAERERLIDALSLCLGVEAFTVMRDVCRLDDDEALAVVRWAAGALLDAALGG